MADRERFNVEIDQAQLDEVLGLLAKFKSDDAKKWLYRGINYGAKQGKLKALEKVLAKSTLKSTIAKKGAVIRFGSLSKPQATLRLQGGKNYLEAFTGTRATKRKGVSFKLWKDEAGEKYRHAFAKRGDIKLGIWEGAINSPEWDGRYPLKRKYGPSVAAIFANTNGVEQEVLNVATNAMLNEITRLMNVDIA